jgi:hypothetical protein
MKFTDVPVGKYLSYHVVTFQKGVFLTATAFRDSNSHGTHHFVSASLLSIYSLV